MRRIHHVFAIAMALAATSSRADTGPAPITTPPLAGCDPLEIGPVYGTSLDASATLACFQLVTPADSRPAKLDINLAGFIAGEPHEVSLIRVDPDGTTHAAAADTSTESFRLMQGIGTSSTRWLILVGRPTAAGVSPFQLQATVAYGLEVQATVYEGDGTTLVGAGQRVVFNASDVEAKKSWSLTSVEATTDDNGIARATLNIGPCRGGLLGPVRMQTPSNRREYWDITYNPESVVLAMVPGSDQAFRPERGWQAFQHVCKEVYRGYRP